MIRWTVLAMAFALALGTSAEAAPDIVVTPSVIHQGDAFFVTVRAEPPVVPRGTIKGRELSFSRGGDGELVALSFIALEDPPGDYTVSVELEGGVMTRPLTVLPLTAKEIHLTLPENKVTLSARDEKRASRELSQMRAAWEVVSARKWNGAFISPVDTEVSTEFGLMRIINGHKKSVHKGVDFKGEEGVPVRSMNGGTVVISNDQFFGGNTVMIDHGDGLFSVYMHLKKRLVKTGQEVRKGVPVGLVGSSGRSTGPHLHLSLKYLGLTVNPLSVLVNAEP